MGSGTTTLKLTDTGKSLPDRAKLLPEGMDKVIEGSWNKPYFIKNFPGLITLPGLSVVQ